MLCTSSALAQSVYVPQGAPVAPWGGYPVAESVPFQPTMDPKPPIEGDIWTEPPAPMFESTVLGPQPYYDPAFTQVDSPGLPSADPYGVESDSAAGDKSLLPPGTRDGVFQKINLQAAWLPRFESDSLGFTDLKANVVLGLPLFTRETPLVITPQYQIHYTDGPTMVDVPPRLHDAQIEFRHFRRLNDCWIFEGAITPGYYADDYSFDTGDAFRLSGRAMMIYESSPEWKWILGAAYVNAAGYAVLPIAGAAYDVGDFKAELVFPRPRIAWRLASSAAPGLDEQWVYVLGEFSGDRWAVERTSGANDVLSYSDWRIVLGYERKIVGGLSRTFEVGYVFNRELEYESTIGDIEIDDTLMVRMGLTY